MCFMLVEFEIDNNVTNRAAKIFNRNEKRKISKELSIFAPDLEFEF